MKTVIMSIAILLASTTTFAQAKKDTSPNHQDTTVTKKYTCTMHPEVVLDKPGKCPKCGMKLVAMKPKNAERKKPE